MVAKNNLKEAIPHFIKILAESGLEKKSIINANSYWRSDMSIINENGLTLDGRTRVNNLCLFDIVVDKVITSENMTTTYNAKISIDIYGEDANTISFEFYNNILSEEQLVELYKNKIGINPQIEVHNEYETIHGVQWLRSHLEIMFTYEYISNKTNSTPGIISADASVSNVDNLEYEKRRT